MNESVFSMNAAVGSALATLDAQEFSPTADLDAEGAFNYARVVRYDVLARSQGISESFASYLIAGLVVSGLESRSVPYHPQELLAITQVVCLEDSSSWSLSPLYDAIARGLSVQDTTKNLVLVSAGMLSAIADIFGSDPHAVASTQRAALGTMVDPIDWDSLLSEG